MKYRSNTEILLKMLEPLTIEPKTKTNMMYAGNMSYTQLNIYMKYILDNKLVKISDLKSNNRFSHVQTYILTPKGNEVVICLQRLAVLLNVPIGSTK